MAVPFHRLLQRQLKRHLIGAPIPSGCEAFLTAVSNAYDEFDGGRRMLERALELSAGELFRANTELRGILQALPDALFRLDADGAVSDLRQGGAAVLALPAVTGESQPAGSPAVAVPGSSSKGARHRTISRFRVSRARPRPPIS
jgi:hypothetical protein